MVRWGASWSPWEELPPQGTARMWEAPPWVTSTSWEASPARSVATRYVESMKSTAAVRNVRGEVSSLREVLMRVGLHRETCRSHASCDLQRRSDTIHWYCNFQVMQDRRGRRRSWTRTILWFELHIWLPWLETTTYILYFPKIKFSPFKPNSFDINSKLIFNFWDKLKKWS